MKSFRNIFLPIIVVGLFIFYSETSSQETKDYLKYFPLIFILVVVIVSIIKSGSISSYFKDYKKANRALGIRRRAHLKSAFLGKEPEYYINESMKKDKEKRKKNNRHN